MNTVEEHLTIAAAAERFHKSPKTIERWIARGLATKDGTKGLYPVCKMPTGSVLIPASTMNRLSKASRIL